VVEDDPWDEELLVRHLRTAKMTQSVLFAQSGAEALELIDDSRRSGWRLTAVFLDLHLRGLGGVGLIKRIRAIQGLENIPVIAMASAQHPVEVEECEKLRVTSYVEKPITAHSLTKAVAHLSASPGGN
jgi:CheY-like chemotaxis protein